MATASGGSRAKPPDVSPADFALVRRANFDRFTSNSPHRAREPGPAAVPGSAAAQGSVAAGPSSAAAARDRVAVRAGCRAAAAGRKRGANPGPPSWRGTHPFDSPIGNRLCLDNVASTPLFRLATPLAGGDRGSAGRPGGALCRIPLQIFTKRVLGLSGRTRNVKSPQG
jgi:hypothetical protein